MRRLMLLLVAAVLVLPLTAQAQGVGVPSSVKVVKAGDASLLTGTTAGMTLYVYDPDMAAGKATCNGPCAASWPPLAADATAKPVGKYTIVTRDDGSLQWAYDGRPLYYWKNDKAPGDTTGDGIGGKWHVARP